MIFGIGTDIVATNRIEQSLAKLGERFAQKILGNQEYPIYLQRQSLHPSKGLHYLCNRFAAKEALAKALGMVFRAPMSWHDAQIINDAQGAPQLLATGALAEFIQQKQLVAKVSLSDEVDYSVAFVVLSQVYALST